MKQNALTHQLPVLIEVEDWAKAERLLKRLADKKGAPAPVFYNFGKVLEAAEKYQQSCRWFSKAIEREKSYANAWFERGRWHLHHGDLLQAYHDFQESLTLNPNDKDAEVNAARLALRLGDWERAEALWTKMDGDEARMARYRVACEQDKDASTLRADILKDPALRPIALKTLVRTAKGSLPLTLE